MSDASPAASNRAVCYCDDCQAFLHRIGRADLLDPNGGTDIVQVAPASLAFHRGEDRIVGLRLTQKGLYRFYTDCCQTPVGNTLRPSIPFVGIVARVFEYAGASADEAFGEPTGAIWGRYATGTPPPGSTRLNLPLIARAFGRIFGWRLHGKAWPHPFFDRRTGAPRPHVVTLSAAEREALRPLCGPRRDAPAHGA